MEDIIKKAIAGGWMQKFQKENSVDFLEGSEHGLTVTFSDIDTGETTAEIYIHEVVCDPSFWQALFPDTDIKCWACKGEKYFEDIFSKKPDLNRPCGNCEQKGTQVKSVWCDNALKFHELAFTEGPDKAVAFLQEITK